MCELSLLNVSRNVTLLSYFGLLHPVQIQSELSYCQSSVNLSDGCTGIGLLCETTDMANRYSLCLPRVGQAELVWVAGCILRRCFCSQMVTQYPSQYLLGLL